MVNRGVRLNPYEEDAYVKSRLDEFGFNTGRVWEVVDPQRKFNSERFRYACSKSYFLLKAYLFLDEKTMCSKDLDEKGMFDNMVAFITTTSRESAIKWCANTFRERIPLDRTCTRVTIVEYINSDERGYIINMHTTHWSGDGVSTALFLPFTKYIYKYGMLAVAGTYVLRWLGYFDRGHIAKFEPSNWDYILEGEPQFTVPFPRRHDRDHSIKSEVLDIDIVLDKYLIANNVTPFVFVTTVIYATLYNMFAPENLIVSYVVNCRDKKHKHCLGNWTNIALMRIDRDCVRTFKSLLQRVSERRMKDREHQSYPINQMVQQITKKMKKPILPNINICETVYLHDMFYLDDVVYIKTIDDVILTNQDENLQVLYACNPKQNLIINFMHKNIDPEFMRLFKSSVQKVICDVIEYDNIDFHTYSLGVKQVEYQQKTEFVSVVSAFNTAAYKHKYNTAITHNGKTITYEELHNRANCIAGNLSRFRKKGQDTIIAIMLPRSIDYVAAILGVLKAGLAYLPLDMDTPAERLSYMLADSHAACVIVENESVRVKYGIERILLNEMVSSESVSHEIAPNDLAYVMYTSGSTGNPKGVMVEHNGIYNVAQNGIYTINSSMTVSQVYSFSVDPSVEELWCALLNGARLCIVDRDVLLTPEKLQKTLFDYHVSICNLPSVLFNTYAQDHSAMFRHVQFLISGGDVMNPKSASLLYSNYPKLNIVNAYGPTEGTVDTTFYLYNWKCSHKSVPIGRPFKWRRVYILNSLMKPVPKGVVGELYIGGDGVARGYINQPKLTEEKFVTYNSQRVYRSGDLCVELPDGNLEFIGRQDNQVKIRGYRVELDEINNTIDYISPSIVIYHNNTLICFHLRKSEEEIREKLTRKLPAYMIPALFIKIEKFPFNSSGKIDVAALKRIADECAVSKKSQKPTTPFEVAMARIWASVLNCHISMMSNFFECGGNSIGIIKTLACIEQELHIRVDAAVFYKCPVLADFCSTRNFNNSFVTETHIQKAFETIQVNPNTVSVSPVYRIFKEFSLNKKNVLIIGASGFLGKYIVKYFMKRREYDVYTLNRKGEETMCNFIGDVSQPEFNTAKYVKLAGFIDIVINAAADVNHVATYDKLAPTNVQGVANIISFCCRERPKRLIHISTLSVKQSKGLMSEGYITSKHVGDILIERAMKRHNLIATIYMPTVVCGDTEIGTMNNRDWFTSLLKTIMTTKTAPVSDHKFFSLPFPIIAVNDFVDIILETFNMSEKSIVVTEDIYLNQIKINDIVEWAEEYLQQKVTRLPFDKWADTIAKDTILYYILHHTNLDEQTEIFESSKCINKRTGFTKEVFMRYFKFVTK